MKTIGIFRKFVKPSVNFIVVLATIIGQFAWGLTRVAADTQNWSATMYATLSDNTVTGNNWPLDKVVTLTVDDPSTALWPDYTFTDTSHEASWNSNILVTEYDLEGIIALKPGLFLTMTDGTQTKTLTLMDLTVNPVDPAQNIVSGTAPAGMLVSVLVYSNSARRHTTADADGYWSVDFSKLGSQGDEQTTIDIPGNSGGVVSVSDTEGDSTSVAWRTILIITKPDEFCVIADNWTLGTSLTMTISGPDLDYSAEATVGYNPNMDHKSSEATRAKFDLPDTIRHLQTGDIVTVTDGTTAKVYTISPLQITDIDLQADTISGVATPGSQVHIWTSPQTGYFTDRWVTANEFGDWQADFHTLDSSSRDTGTFDLQAGSDGQVSETDNDGNKSWINWEVPFNQPPHISSISAPTVPVRIGQSIDAVVEFSDPDDGDTHTVNWSWGDGTETMTPAVVPSARTSHVYFDAGVYTITATIVDAAGQSAVETFQYVVVYDPTGGFVTGGGWIWSPEKAYSPNPSLTGKATFGFVSKYQKGASVPTGSTEFQFRVADLNFKSTSYDWLVIADSKAKYKGTGTVNGMGEYGFMLSAIDGSPDMFRIKIWDKATGETVYDNQIGMADNADLVTAIDGGSIVVHKVK